MCNWLNLKSTIIFFLEVFVCYLDVSVQAKLRFPPLLVYCIFGPDICRSTPVQLYMTLKKLQEIPGPDTILCCRYRLLIVLKRLKKKYSFPFRFSFFLKTIESFLKKRWVTTNEPLVLNFSKTKNNSFWKNIR